MIRKGWFLQGHLDEQKACLMTSREAFEQYQELMAQARQQKAREQETKERQKQTLTEEQVWIRKYRK